MRKLARIIIRKLIANTAGKKKYQNFYELLLDIAVRGMNYKSGNFKTSGELTVVRLLASRKEHKIEKVIIFDVGANIGDYTVELAHAFESDNSTIFSFEPSGLTYAELVKKTEHLKNVIPNNFGFSDSKKTTHLHYDKPHSGLASLYKRDLNGVNIELDKVENVNVITIDEFCASNKIKKINFIKIDVEGHEFDVLIGAKNMLINSNIDFIQFEFGEANIDSRKYFKNFYDLLPNYEFYRVVKDGITPLGKYDSMLEIFKTVNFLAIRNGI